jgi:hypothetical protein
MFLEDLPKNIRTKDGTYNSTIVTTPAPIVPTTARFPIQSLFHGEVRKEDQ